MTCIVATASFVAADRRITDELHEAGTMRKVGKNKHLIAGTAGNASSVLAVLALLKKGAETPEDLLEGIDKDSVALVLTTEGKLWKCVKDEAWACPLGSIEAIGSGGDLAYAWLHGYYQVAKPVPSVKDVRTAIKFAASRRVDCGGGVDVRHF